MATTGFIFSLCVCVGVCTYMPEYTSVAMSSVLIPYSYRVLMMLHMFKYMLMLGLIVSELASSFHFVNIVVLTCFNF